jgi:hypothetical protein
MSLVAISGNASGTGTLTIAAPNTNSNFTLTLPTNTGTLITTSSTGQVIPKAALPAGSVLQVVQGTTTANTLTSSTTFVTTGLAASITPSSSTSKILITCSGGEFDINSGGQQVYGTIYRNSTNLGGGTATAFTDVFTATYRSIFPVCVQYLDSPATTSSTTYTLYFYSGGGGNTVRYNGQGSMGVITLMEIAA